MANLSESKWTRKKIREVLTPVLVVIGLLYTYHSHVTGCPRQVILGSWAVLPPVWMFIEYLLFDSKTESLEDFEHFKYRQSLLRNLWVGMVVLLSALYLGQWD